MSKIVVPQPKGMMGEFMHFLSKTNAIALAIGVIIGGAATKLVGALVSDFLNPIIGKVLSGIDLNSMKLVLGEMKNDKGEVVQSAITYGHFISTLIDFVITMLVVFIIVKLVAKDMLEDK